MPAEPVIVHREIVIELFPSRVFDAWADPLEITHWYADRAEGDARHDPQIMWTIGGADQPLDVTVVEPSRHVVLTNVGHDQWKGTTLDINFEPEGAPGSTRVVLEQVTPDESLRDFMPIVDSGWACTLAVLSEYLLYHAGARRTQVAAHTPGAVDIAVLSQALASADAISEWAGDHPVRVLVSAPRGAVVTFDGFPGVFTLMGVGGANVLYATWDDTSIDNVKAKVADLTDRLWARIGVSLTQPAT